MPDLVLYIHGKGGNAEESQHYEALFPHCEVMGLDYQTFTPWETGREIAKAVENFKGYYDNIILIANSIGAFFSMNAELEGLVKQAYFISPIVNMDKLISDMMTWANVTEDELREQEIIHTDFGEDLSWKYLSYVRSHPIKWTVPTKILYGENDKLTSLETIKDFAETHDAGLTVMPEGEHWFHTDAQMNFLDSWLENNIHFRINRGYVTET